MTDNVLNSIASKFATQFSKQYTSKCVNCSSTIMPFVPKCLQIISKNTSSNVCHEHHFLDG